MRAFMFALVVLYAAEFFEGCRQADYQRRLAELDSYRDLLTYRAKAQEPREFVVDPDTSIYFMMENRSGKSKSFGPLSCYVQNSATESRWIDARK